MAQGWQVDPSTDIITFQEAPPTGSNNVVVKEFGAGAFGGTDVWAVGAWSSRYGYPSEVEFFNDRLWFAGTPSDPQTVWASCIGDYNNFGRSSPIVDSDTVTFAINARQVNVIRDFIPLDSLMIMTTGGEYKVTGGQDDVVTPSTIGVKNQGNSGTSDVQSKVIGESAIFVQEEGQKPRDLAYKFEKDGFRGSDIGVWADHFFEGYEVRWIEHWKSPWQVVWFTRDDGVRIGCTYMPEQEVIGWHQHDTDGLFLDACSLPARKESECYYLVQRVVNGETVQVIEQQAPTRYDHESDLFYVDFGATYDGRNTSSTTLTLSTAGGWTENDELTITASAPIFVGVGDQGDGFVIRREVTSIDDGVVVVTPIFVRLVIDAYVNGTQVTARSIGTVPADLQGYAATDWDFQRDTITDLWHLEGKVVQVLQDAAVAGPFTVTNGAVALATPGGVVQVGLPFVAEWESLEVNSGGGEPMRDQKKLAYQVAILLLASRGVEAAGSDKVFYPIKERRFENYGQPPFLKSGIFETQVNAAWGQDNGKVYIRSTDPLPLEILSLTTKIAASN